MASLTTKTVEKIIRTGLAGMTNDGDGLYLKVGRSGGASWIFRYKIAGKSQDMGLGGSPEVSLAKAREKAAEARKLSKSGVDPLTSRDEGREWNDDSWKKRPSVWLRPQQEPRQPLSKTLLSIISLPTGRAGKMPSMLSSGKHVDYLCVQGHR